MQDDAKQTVAEKETIAKYTIKGSVFSEMEIGYPFLFHGGLSGKSDFCWQFFMENMFGDCRMPYYICSFGLCILLFK